MRQALAACRGGFGAVMLFSLCVNILTLSVPLYMMQIFDRVLSSRSMDTLLMISLITGCALLTLAALDAMRGLILLRVSAWIERRLGGDALAGCIRSALARGGASSAAVLRDLATFRSFLGSQNLTSLLDAPWSVLFIGVIYLIHPALGLVALAGAVLLFSFAVLNDLATRAAIARAGRSARAALDQADAAVRNADVVEAMGILPNLIDRWRRQNDDALDLQCRAAARGTMFTSLSRFTRLCVQVTVLGVGASLVLANEISPGAMMAAAIIMSRALAPVEMAIGSWRLMVGAHEAYHRLREMLSGTPQRRDAMKLPAPNGDVNAEAVTFFHPGATEPVLRGIGFRLAPGESLGLIGPTMAGKTTLARLLVGNLRPRTGHVRLDGMDVAEWEPEDLGPHIGYLPQDVELFGGTVRDNIARMGEADADDVISAAQLAGVHDMILHLPAGYDTEIGDGGCVLSGGLRQRIALARALFGDPRLVVLDEPNANLDRAGEEALIEALLALRKRNVTTIVIAHRPGILQHADKVLELHNGAIRAFGARDEVMSRLSGTASGRLLSVAAGASPEQG